MEELYAYLKENPVAYVTREHERAEGLAAGTTGYYIISNEGSVDTYKLLGKDKVISKIDELGTSILVFKNTNIIEDIALKNSWKLLNPSATLGNTVEEKLSQVSWLSELAYLLPPHHIDALSNIAWSGSPFILQYNHAHSGEGTILIESEDQLSKLREKFPRREVRTSEYIKGPVYTNNNIVAGSKILKGNISYQITGDPGLTDDKFATRGNDWGKAEGELTGEHREKYLEIAEKIGKKLIESGWKGMFGIDVIVNKSNNKMYLIEINARQVASAVYESKLQDKAREHGASGITTFEAHLASLLGLDLDNHELIKITEGRREINRKDGNRN